MSVGIQYAGTPGVGYSKADGRFAPIHKLTLADAANLTASANGTGIDVGECGVACLTLNVTAHTAGGDTLDIAVQTSADNSTWRSVGTFTQSTDVGTERKSFSGLDRFVRYAATLAGAGVDVTFTLSGDLK